MELKSMNCPNCGHPVKVDMTRKNYFCQYCGSQLLFDDGVQKVQHEVTGGFEFGYQEELGRQKALEEMQRQKAEAARRQQEELERQRAEEARRQQEEQERQRLQNEALRAQQHAAEKKGKIIRILSFVPLVLALCQGKSGPEVQLYPEIQVFMFSGLAIRIFSVILARKSITKHLIKKHIIYLLIWIAIYMIMLTGVIEELTRGLF